MGQLQKVSWRTAGYAAFGTALAASSVIAVVNSDGVHPTSLVSNAATRWLVDRANGNVVLVDGLAGHVVAKISTESPGGDEVAVQGPGGAFLVGKAQGSVRTISTAKMQIGTPKTVGLLLEQRVKFGVGASGLTVVSATADNSEASVVAVDDVTRSITVPKADNAYVAADGSMWLVSNSTAVATHVNIDESSTSVPLTSIGSQTATVGPHAVSYDARNRTVHWLDGGDIVLDSVPNPSEAIIQESGDDAPCVWLGSGNTLACVGRSGVDHSLTVDGMNISANDRLAIAGSAAVVVKSDNEVQRIDLEHGVIATNDIATVPGNVAALSITASADLIWLDDLAGQDAWIVHRFGINHVTKNDTSAPQLDAQGQVQENGQAAGEPAAGGGNAPGAEDQEHVDPNPGIQDPPIALDDSVTARAGSTITIPVLGNDYDPDGDAIAVLEGDTVKATHGTTNVLNGSSVSYRPEIGYSGSDSFEYTIVDEHGATATATVSVELFPPDSPNRPPIARADNAQTRINRPVVIDVLANDIDPERDTLTVPTFQVDAPATVKDTTGPTGLPALLYTPPPDTPGIHKFTYQAVDPQGGTSQRTVVTVDVSGADARNDAPTAAPDAIRLSVGVPGDVNVLANDTDPDGDELRITKVTGAPGVTAAVLGQQLHITLRPGAEVRTVIRYTLSDGNPSHDQQGKVLVLKIGDNAPNGPPVANPDVERVVIGNTVKIAVTANDADPENDPLRVLTAGDPSDGAGTTRVEENFVRFTPNLPDITEPTPVTFEYRITDGHGNEAIGNVTVTVLLQALPAAPFARDDFADTFTDRPVNIDVLANDTDPSGGKPSLIDDPVCQNGGEAKRTADNRVSFTPPTGATGTYRCKYTVSNTQELSATAFIIVTVTEAPPGNRPPVIDKGRLTKSVDVGAFLVLNASEFATDDDPNDHLVFTSVSFVGPVHGAHNFQRTSDTFVYTAPSAGLADRTPVTDTLDITISDGNDGNDRGFVSIKINDPAPVIAPPNTHEINAVALVGDTLPIDVVSALTDENTTPITLIDVSGVTGPGTAELVGGQAVIKPTGAGTIVANYTVKNDGGQSKNKITVVVSERPQANPPAAEDDTLTVGSGGTVTFDLLANDSGIGDPGDIVTAQLINRPPASFGSVQLLNGVLSFAAAPNAAGQTSFRYSLTDGVGPASIAFINITVLPCVESAPNATLANVFTPYATPISIDLNQYVISGHIRDGSVSGAGLTGPTGVFTPPPGMNGSEVVTYVVENGCRQTFQGQLTIDVNHPPVSANITRTLTRGSKLTLPVELLASDDAGEALKIISIDGNPGWVTLDPGGPNGNSGLDVPSIIAAPPANVASKTYSFNATVQDPGGLTATSTIHLVISNVAPTAIADQYTTDQQLFTFDPTQNDTDPDSEPGTLRIQSVTAVTPADTSITVTGNAVSVALDHGQSTLSYTLVDDGGLTDTSTITITYNRKPTIQPDSVFAEPGSTRRISLDIFEPDSDDVTVECVSQNPLLVASVEPDPDQGPPASDPTHPKWQLVVIIDESFPPSGSDSIACTVTDSFGAKASANILITARN